MYKIIDYFTNKIIANNIPTKTDADIMRQKLLKEKTKYDHDYTTYNWLLLIYKQ